MIDGFQATLRMQKSEEFRLPFFPQFRPHVLQFLFNSKVRRCVESGFSIYISLAGPQLDTMILKKKQKTCVEEDLENMESNIGVDLWGSISLPSAYKPADNDLPKQSRFTSYFLAIHRISLQILFSIVYESNHFHYNVYLTYDF